MKRKILVAPSLLAADFKNLSLEILKMEKSGADYLHFDVMDGHFVDNISFGSGVLKSIGKVSNLINDVHLMIDNPEKYYFDFVQAGADIITVHYEAFSSIEELKTLLCKIKKSGIKVGVSIRPKTDVKVLDSVLDKVDLILVMSVEPGFGGQKFMPSALDKISYLREYIDKRHLDVLIEVDGGVNQENISLLKNVGVDVLVAGTYLFRNDDPQKAIKEMKL